MTILNSKSNKIASAIFFIAIALLTLASSAWAQDVTVGISTREAYVGMPVVLQFQVTNAAKYEFPPLPEIDGCTVTDDGQPSTSARITMFNGRRSETRTATKRYLITPRREGEFKIPELTLFVDGQPRTSEGISFVATKSETGDLMFAEIEGGKPKVYVGEPLDLKLKIWLKPFHDRKNNIKLSESQMWQLLSRQTSWGSFADSIQEMSENRQRPQGLEILRPDAEGKSRSYYLYEVKTTIYPTRTGSIDADDVQIIVNYPLELGRSRDPFENMLGGRSSIRQMMSEDFGSPFGSRLTVTASRPIVADIKLDSTKVVAIPTANRPSDYRGAVGRYQIATKAEPKTVAAGDPITLRIFVVGNGDGPMELIQAPPLSEITSVTDDFKVSDQALAGFVQDETKVFATTVRPRRQGITEIPAIPFSFFDPVTESFETVFSDPIEITVNESEMLSLDSIVGNGGSSTPFDSPDPSTPDLENIISHDVLDSPTSVRLISGFWYFVILPPVAWFIVAVSKLFWGAVIGSSRFKSPITVGTQAIEIANNQGELSEAMRRYIQSRFGRQTMTSVQAVGALRTARIGELAIQVESEFASLLQDEASTQELAVRKASVKGILRELETAFANSRTANIRPTPQANPSKTLASAKPSSGQIAGFLVALLTPLAMGANAPQSPESETAALSRAQLETVLDEANEHYQNARELAQTDAAEANEQFLLAEEKYSLLIKSGVSSAGLFLNLGNAQLATGQFGRAIANYHRCLKTTPFNQQATRNLSFANSKIESSSSANESGFPADLGVTGSLKNTAFAGLKTLRSAIHQFVGFRSLSTIVAVASILFWLLLALPFFGVRTKVWRLAMVPLFVLVGTGLLLSLNAIPNTNVEGILVANQVQLREGDGFEFPVRHQIDAGEGKPVEILSKRGDWIQIRTSSDASGWVSAKSIAVIK
ncbi:MAG: tetratricopeptide (TPR) repeat protein [Mariniblastus sp.]|jgi:tetratricopeptide (TPR) repeat protein